MANARVSWRRLVAWAMVIVLVTGGLVAVSTDLGSRAWRKLTGGRSVAAVLNEISPRVESAYPMLAALTSEHRLVLVALKDQQRLMVYASRPGEPWRQIAAWPFTASSGALGPKQRSGDYQIPEGHYAITHLNPNSAYHLSIGVAYPNAFDRARAAEDGREQLGGDIFIHGKAVTIGCIPIGDAAIEALFYAVARVGVARVQALFAPCDLRQSDPPALDLVWADQLYAPLREQMLVVMGPLAQVTSPAD